MQIITLCIKMQNSHTAATMINDTPLDSVMTGWDVKNNKSTHLGWQREWTQIFSDVLTENNTKNFSSTWWKFTKWLSSHWNWTTISSHLPMSLVWAFTQTQCLAADSKRRVWISYHIKIVRLFAALNHSQAPAYLSGTRPNCSKCISIDTERHMKTGFMFAANWGKKRKKISYVIKTSFQQGHMPQIPPLCISCKTAAQWMWGERCEKVPCDIPWAALLPVSVAVRAAKV